MYVTGIANEAGERVVEKRNTDVVVVIPAYKQPGFLPEAIESVLAQVATLGIAAVVVNDGCPFPETASVGIDYSRAHPGRVYYLRKSNGGLSSARNAGVEFTLRAFPQCGAIYFLDADNRLFPDFIQRAWDALSNAQSHVGWVYPDIDMFGMRQNCTVRGPYSALMHLLENYCEAGSLVSRKVFDRGVRFDENMKQGFEDWEFWLQSAAAGFRGLHLPRSGFRYRRRAESMLSHSERARDAILGYMRTKHVALLRPRSLLRLEAEELPRYALYDVDLGSVSLMLDPDGERSEVLTLAKSRERLIRAMRTPSSESFPGVTCITQRGVLDGLRRWRLARNLFWGAQRLLRDAHFVMVRVVASADNEIAVVASNGPPHPSNIARAGMLFARSDIVAESARDKTSIWLESLITDNPGPRAVEIEVRLPGDESSDTFNPDSLLAEFLFLEVANLRKLLNAGPGAPSEWRPDARMRRNQARLAYEKFCGTPLMFPHIPIPGRINIGFILPLMEFGGVEKVIINYARTLRDEGFVPHLFITGAQRIKTSNETVALFESINFIFDASFESGDWDERYFGTWTAPQKNTDSMQCGVGLLGSMHAVLNTHSLGAQGLMALLKAQGVKTFLGLHLIERAASGQPIGNSHVALAYEHAYDGIVVISEQLRDWCIGQAMPASKIFKVANAPSYAVDESKRLSVLADRRRRRSKALNVLYLGRLDAQKGLDRLAAIIRETADDPICWRIVGKSIVEGTLDQLAGLRIKIEEPALDMADLDAVYAWADVVVLCSRFEGVPLTILEAQRFGCVALATDVGAVSEIIEHRKTGILVGASAPEDQIVREFVHELRSLASDRASLYEIGLRASNYAGGLTWKANMQDWVSAVRAMTEGSESP